MRKKRKVPFDKYFDKLASLTEKNDNADSDSESDDDSAIC